jgi:predicted SAM-dependent methyltransferase
LTCRYASSVLDAAERHETQELYERPLTGIMRQPTVSPKFQSPSSGFIMPDFAVALSSKNPIPTVPVERKVAICRLIDLRNEKGLEFGPLSRPIVRPEEGDIRYIDHAPTEELRKKYVINDGHNVDEFVEISYIWNGGRRLRDVIDDGTVFDYALASHVIEHVPDVVGWLNDILSVLKDDGVLGLAIPDKRYTFDRYRTPTSAAIFLDHWMRQPRVHTAQQLFDHFSQVVKVGNNEIMALFDGKDPVTERHSTDEYALSIVRRVASTGQYLDCHASVFTPRSFLEALKVLIPLGVIEAVVADFYNTRYYSQEFVCVLRRSKSRDISSIVDLLSRLPPD